jgi:hypothetical protein
MKDLRIKYNDDCIRKLGHIGRLCEGVHTLIYSRITEIRWGDGDYPIFIHH